jgi:hypothetical protein
MTSEEFIQILTGYESELQAILGRFTKSRDGILHIDLRDEPRVEGIATEVIDLLRDHVSNPKQDVHRMATAYNEGGGWLGSRSYAGVERIIQVISSMVVRYERSPTLLAAPKQEAISTMAGSSLSAGLSQIVSRFHAVAVQLRNRHAQRETLAINDEYDVQDLIHALLRLHFDDIRPEEWAPSYAGGASRMDFLLPSIGTVIETKMTRQGLNARKIGEQLIIDIAKYQKHPQCHHLVCFVYDPAGFIANPTGLENDLNSPDHRIDVKVVVLPKHT